ncbi:hypothetical protein Pla52n_07970 [Stieleria varia]|uniref:DUF1559 domain-containing protein n=2 Tax=Stieleria varia TaxID=2528005 RepID=A0A5C6B7I2_9BACT|nr:hypothetical protein Pla52n_07970 [Stieleria varia]
MLVVIAIIGLLAGMLMPALSKAREAMRAAQCSHNLSNFGAMMRVRSSREPSGKFCSGAFDFQRDGVPTEIGWVADLVDDGSIMGQMRCPSNDSATSKAIESLLTAPISDFATTACIDRLGRTPYTSETGQVIENVARTIVTTGAGPGTPLRAEIIYRKMIDKGYNTNYAASWFLMRTEMLLDGAGNLRTQLPGCANVDIRGLNVTRGPLKASYLDSSQAPSSTIPFLMDVSPTGFLSETLGEGELNMIAGGSMYVPSIVGSPIGNARSIDTDLDGSPDAPNPFYLTTPVFPPSHPRSGPTGWLKTWSYDTRQDYRLMNPLHSGVANCLMADNSVQPLYDANGDGFINNGFEVNTAAGQLYWRDSTVEADSMRLASYYSLMSKGPSQ